MIRYALKCKSGHGFESWFQNADAFDGLMSKGFVSCPECGSGEVEKAIMAPRIRPASRAAKKPEKPDLGTPQNQQAAEMARLRKKIEAESEYVGMQFASEARAIHDGDAPERAIYGEAKPEEALKLVEEGVQVAPLPFIPARKTN
ncbi:MAG: DUF1178 family protein [Rhodobacteraceae bacterium]|nr:DUF1178 family protein [Paracoccaceae bacterium]